MDHEQAVTGNADQLLNIVIGNHGSDARALRQAFGVCQFGSGVTSFVQINNQNAITATEAKTMGVGGSAMKPRASLAVAFLKFEVGTVQVVTLNSRRQSGVRNRAVPI